METPRYSQLLLMVLHKRIAKNPSYSLRALARDLSVNPSDLSRFLRGKAIPGTKNIRNIIKKVSPDELIPEEFVEAILQHQKINLMAQITESRALSPNTKINES